MTPDNPQSTTTPISDEQKGLQDLRYDQADRQRVVLARQRELKEAGFSDEFITNHPEETLVGANISVHERLDSLKSQGFNSPIALIEKFPPILGFSPKNIDNKLAELRNQGFNSPIALIEKVPSILSFSPKNINNKLAELHNQGFNSPIALIEKLPSILNYSPKNIDNKLAELHNQGFNSPIALIEKAPSILNLSPKYINRKLRMFRRLIYIFDSPIDPIALMEQETALFGTKIDKLWTLTRIARNSLQTANEIDRKLIHDILFANLEDVMLALEEIGDNQETDTPDYTIQQLVSKAKEIKKQKIPKDSKREMIKNADHIDEMVKKRYFRGYPMKSE